MAKKLVKAKNQNIKQAKKYLKVTMVRLRGAISNLLFIAEEGRSLFMWCIGATVCDQGCQKAR